MNAVPRIALVLCALLLLPVSADAGRGRKKHKIQPVAEFYAEASRAIATVEFSQQYVAGGQKQQTRSYTDGVVVSADGLVLISGRVRFPQRSGSGRISGGTLPELSGFLLHFADGSEHKAEPVAFENDLNLGLLRITDLAPGESLPHVRFAEDHQPAIGQTLRSLTLYSQDYGRTPVLQGLFVGALLDTPQDVWSLGGVTSGLIGAPIWDERGLVVGVVAQVPMSPWAGRQVVPDLSGPVGLAYSRFRQWLSEAPPLQARGVTPAAEPESDGDAAWLGVEFQPLDRDLARHLGVSEGGGVIIKRVIPGSPAEVAGLVALDILVELNGARIAVSQDSDTPLFSRRIRALKPGDQARFVVERAGGQRQDFVVTLVRAPKPELYAERRQNAAFELSVRELTLDTRLAQRLPAKEQGVVIDGVTGAGWAGLAGLVKGDILQRINEHPVTDLDSFEAALTAVAKQRPDKVLFFVRYRRDTRFRVAEPDWDDLPSTP